MKPSADESRPAQQAFAEVLSAFDARQFERAEELCRQALARWPQQAHLWNLLATLQARRNDPQAREGFAAAVRLLPGEPAFRRNLAEWLRQHQALDEAMLHYRSLELTAAERKTLARYMMQADRLEFVDELLAPLLAPADAAVLDILAKTRLLEGNWRAAQALYAEALWRRRGKPWNAASPAPPTEPPAPQALLPHKLRHDLEQWRYLAEHRLLPPERLGPLQTLETLWQQWSQGQSLPAWQGINAYIEALPEVGGTVLNPQLDVETLEAAYARRGVIQVDDLLKPEIRERIYLYCLRSTIWHAAEKSDGYVGSMMEDGLTGALLFQLAHELRDTLPGIFRGLPLRYMWAFKYDSQRRGIRLHGDPAAVNVNFWLTPDQANLDAASGGLLVYPERAPADWHFEDYNLIQASEKMHAFLAAKGCEPLRIPYRCNRAVIFCSDMFHATDYFMFHDAYSLRRINLTLLFGRRGQ